jgi:chromosomal replication initiator protein
MHEAVMTEEKWGQLRQKLRKTVGQNNFTQWIEPLEFQTLSDGVAVFSVPTNFMGNYVGQNFSDLILYEFNKAGEACQRLSFQVAANRVTRPSAVEPAAAAPSSEATGFSTSARR